MKKQRSIAGLLWAAITLLGANAATAQPATSNATVVFYTHGNRATSSLPGTKNGIFWGKLYDGKDLLLNFRQGFFAENNLIIAIAFEPGPHTFSAGYPTMPTKHGQLSLALEPNKTYFVRAESESEGIVLVEFEKGRLDQVSCEIARKETQKATLLSNKKLVPNRRGSIVPLPFPVTCP